jgi:hypothetical protein
MAMCKVSKSAAALPPSVRKNMHIPFVSKVKKMDKVDGPDADKSEWIKLEILMDPDNPASKYPLQLSIFKNGYPEEWIKWVMAFRQIDNLMPMKKPADNTRISDFVEGSSLVLSSTSSYEEVGGRRLRGLGQ